MADGDLFQADLDIAFTFSRSEAGAYRNAAGSIVQAAIDAPRFDHDAEGQPLGLLINEGSDLGLQDRLAIDPLILPEALIESPLWQERACTVFHAFIPKGGEQLLRNAWYSRDARRTIDALMRQQGHHQAIGVIEGFRENLGGFVRLRGQVWQLASYLLADEAVLTDGEGQPMVTAGAEVIDG